jgi:hypothetical protein
LAHLVCLALVALPLALVRRRPMPLLLPDMARAPTVR